MQKFINELELDVAILSFIILKNNELNIKLVHNTEQHNYIKYINIQHHYIYNMIDDKKLIVK